MLNTLVDYKTPDGVQCDRVLAHTDRPRNASWGDDLGDDGLIAVGDVEDEDDDDEEGDVAQL